MDIVTKDPVAIAAACLHAKLNRGRMSHLHGVLDDIWDGAAAGKHKIVAAVIDGEYVGVITLTTRTKLISIYVKESHRRQGIGSRLITELENYTGLTRMQFNARPGKEEEPFFERNRVISYPDDVPLSISETQIILENPYKAAAIIRKKRRDYRKGWIERMASKGNSENE